MERQPERTYHLWTSFFLDQFLTTGDLKFVRLVTRMRLVNESLVSAA